MADVTIRLRPNGPLVVEGPFRLIDSRGAQFEIPTNKPAVALCRCGQSAKRPFCDGTHKSCGFISDEAPTPPAVGELRDRLLFTGATLWVAYLCSIIGVE